MDATNPWVISNRKKTHTDYVNYFNDTNIFNTKFDSDTFSIFPNKRYRFKKKLLHKTQKFNNPDTAKP